MIQNLTVPNGMYYMFVDIRGASSGQGIYGTAGRGARVQSTLSVVPGAVLHFVVGCIGSNCPTSSLASNSYISGGYNGGGSGYSYNGNVGGSGGGGASDIRIGGLSFANRVIVAGGGGGFYCGSNCGIKYGVNGGETGAEG
jgi:hypothetical protein